MDRRSSVLNADQVQSLRRGAIWFFGVPVRRQTYRNLAYLLLAFPLGIGYFVLYVTGFALGVGLLIILVGIGVIALTFLIALACAGFERILTNWLLGTEIEPQIAVPGDRSRDRIWAILTNPKTWTAMVYLPVKMALGLGAFIFLVIAIPTGVGLLTVPLYYNRPGVYVGFITERAPEVHQTIYLGWNYLLVGFEAAFTVGYWEISSLTQAMVVGMFGIICILLTLHISNFLAYLWGRFANLTLGGTFDPIAAIVEGSGE